MTLIGDCYRQAQGHSQKKNLQVRLDYRRQVSNSGRLMTRLQLAWVIKHGIKSVITILEIPLHEKWFEGCAGVEYRHLQVEVYGAPLDQTVDIIDYIDSKIETINLL